MALTELSKIRYKKIECFAMMMQNNIYGIDSKPAILTTYHLQPTKYTYPSFIPKKIKFNNRNINILTGQIREYRFIETGGQILQFIPYMNSIKLLEEEFKELKTKNKNKIKKIDKDLVELNINLPLIKENLDKELFKFRNKKLESQDLCGIVKHIKPGKELPLEQLLQTQNTTWLKQQEIIHNFSTKKIINLGLLIGLLSIGTGISIAQNLDEIYKYGIKMPADIIAKILDYNMDNLKK